MGKLLEKINRVMVVWEQFVLVGNMKRKLVFVNMFLF